MFQGAVKKITLLYLQNMDDHMLEEQAADLPVFGEGNFISYTNWLYRHIVFCTLLNMHYY